MCTVLVADMSGCSIPLTIWAPTVQEIDVRESQIVDVKARTSVYKSAAQLSAFLEDCTLAASSVEAHELHAGWSRARPEVRPLTPAYTFTPVASLARGVARRARRRRGARAGRPVCLRRGLRAARRFHLGRRRANASCRAHGR